MELTTAICAGALVAMLGNLAPALLFELALGGRARMSIAAGLASVTISFLTQTVALYVVFRYATEGFLPFGCAMAAVYVLIWAVEACRGVRAALGDPHHPTEGRESE